MLRVLTTCLLVLMTGVAGTRAQPRQPAIPADVEELLWWLPPDTETIEVTQTPANPRGPLFADMGPDEIVAEELPYAGILTQHRGNPQGDLEGSGHFRPPRRSAMP